VSNQWILKCTIEVRYEKTTLTIRHHIVNSKQAREQKAKDEAKKKENDANAIKKDRKNRRHDYFVAAFGAVLGAILALLIEHMDKAIAFFVNLFH